MVSQSFFQFLKFSKKKYILYFSNFSCLGIYYVFKCTLWQLKTYSPFNKIITQNNFQKTWRRFVTTRTFSATSSTSAFRCSSTATTWRRPRSTCSSKLWDSVYSSSIQIRYDKKRIYSCQITYYPDLLLIFLIIMERAL